MKLRLSPIIRGLAVVGLLAAGALVAVAGQRIFASQPAYATPGTGFTSTILARGGLGPEMSFGAPKTVVVKRKVKIKTKRGVVVKTVRVKVGSILKAINCPCDTAFQQATIQPGGTTGWHTHPGATFVAVAQGELTYYHVHGNTCASEKMTAGSGFSQMPTLVHVGRNESSVPVILYTYYVLPPGTPNSGIRIDQPQPAGCPTVH